MFGLEKYLHQNGQKGQDKYKYWLTTTYDVTFYGGV